MGVKNPERESSFETINLGDEGNIRPSASPGGEIELKENPRSSKVSKPVNTFGSINPQGINVSVTDYRDNLGLGGGNAQTGGEPTEEEQKYAEEYENWYITYDGKTFFKYHSMDEQYDPSFPIDGNRFKPIESDKSEETLASPQGKNFSKKKPLSPDSLDVANVEIDDTGGDDKGGDDTGTGVGSDEIQQLKEQIAKLQKQLKSRGSASASASDNSSINLSEGQLNALASMEGFQPSNMVAFLKTFMILIATIIKLNDNNAGGNGDLKQAMEILASGLKPEGNDSLGGVVDAAGAMAENNSPSESSGPSSNTASTPSANTDAPNVSSGSDASQEVISTPDPQIQVELDGKIALFMQAKEEYEDAEQKFQAAKEEYDRNQDESQRLVTPLEKASKLYYSKKQNLFDVANAAMNFITEDAGEEALRVLESVKDPKGDEEVETLEDAVENVIQDVKEVKEVKESTDMSEDEAEKIEQGIREEVAVVEEEVDIVSKYLGPKNVKFVKDVVMLASETAGLIFGTFFGKAAQTYDEYTQSRLSPSTEDPGMDMPQETIENIGAALSQDQNEGIEMIDMGKKPDTSTINADADAEIAKDLNNKEIEKAKREMEGGKEKKNKKRKSKTKKVHKKGSKSKRTKKNNSKKNKSK